jgi:polyisoprenoid-binding protein YceI
LATADFNVSVDVKSIDTDSENRDEHLRSESYFDADKYPVITIKSTKVNGDKSKGSYDFFGTLTMHGVTRNISFPFVATPHGNDYLFSGEFEINRLDYSVGESSAVLGKGVKVSLSVLARKG